MLGLNIHAFLLITTAVLALPVLVAILMSLRNLRVLGAIESPSEREERGHFMALLGLVASSFFLVLMMVSAIAVFFFGLCQR
jgi:hypothetical protein